MGAAEAENTRKIAVRLFGSSSVFSYYENMRDWKLEIGKGLIPAFFL
jgi:hypothetical protein